MDTQLRLYSIKNVYNSYVIQEDVPILLITLIIDCIQELKLDRGKEGLIKKRLFELPNKLGD